VNRKTESIGRQGEYLVCSFLSKYTATVNIVAHSAEEDIVFKLNDRYYGCQVKTKSKKDKNKNGWRFDLRRGSHTLNRNYKESIDIFALVCLPKNKIYFLDGKYAKESLTLNDFQLDNLDEDLCFQATLQELI
tara:strand:- start:752 stop:1150 length:399 start_codon:yes stop_codon:yes gene_type:complete